MKMRISDDAKIGLLVLICLAALAAVLLRVGNYSFFKHGYSLKSRFHFTGGVKRHAPVRLCGVDVGEVRDIQLIYGDETLIELDLWLNEGVKVRKDAVAYVTTLGLMGEKYIEIKSGTNTVDYASADELITGEDPVRLEELVKIGTKVAEDVGKMANDISTVAKSVDNTISDNRAKIDEIFDNLDETSVNFRDFSQDIKFHPWKILMKGKEKSKEEMEADHAKMTAERQIRKNNFAAKKGVK